jgi:hypothetical protein
LAARIEELFELKMTAHLKQVARDRGPSLAGGDDGSSRHQRVSRDSGAASACFSLFWHALDIVWVWLFTVVYLMGVLS